VRTGGDLRERIGLDATEVAGGHFRGEQLAPGRVDAFADDDERAIEADDDFAARRTDDGLGHEVFLSAWSLESLPGATDAARQHTRAIDDFGHGLFLAVGHDVCAVDAPDRAQLLQQIHAQVASLAGLIAGAAQSRDDGVGNVDSRHVRAHPLGGLRGTQWPTPIRMKTRSRARRLRPRA
jgi:hypothetical protein